jgi:hypothetical protein
MHPCSLSHYTEELQQQAGVFRKNAKDLKDKMWWKDMKVCTYCCCCL